MTREEIVNEYFTEHRCDILLNPYAGLLDFAKYLDKHSELLESLEEAAEKAVNDVMYDIIWAVGASNWNKELDSSVRSVIKNLFIAGAKWDRAKMMESAEEADVNTYEDLAAGKSWAEFVVEMPTNNIGDKVKIIVIPEEK